MKKLLDFLAVVVGYPLVAAVGALGGAALFFVIAFVCTQTVGVPERGSEIILFAMLITGGALFATAAVVLARRGAKEAEQDREP